MKGDKYMKLYYEKEYFLTEGNEIAEIKKLSIVHMKTVSMAGDVIAIPKPGRMLQKKLIIELKRKSKKRFQNIWIQYMKSKEIQKLNQENMIVLVLI